MKKLMTVVALMSFASSLMAQCPSGNINLFKQSDINTFVAAFPNCEEIDGNLVLGQLNGDSDIQDLTGLSKLSGVNGSLTILGNPNLISLNGLENLQYIGEDLSVIQNPGLTSLQGLNSLTSIGGSFFLSYQENVVNLNGLNQLATIGGDLSLNYTPSLTSLEGLEALTTIYGSFIVESNDQLLSMKGLDNLQMIGVDLILRSNSAFIRMDGLEKLESIGRDLRIGWEYLDGYAGNPMLSDLDALANLSTIGGKLGIMGNENLSACAIDAICDFLSVGGPAIIKDNAPGCDTKEEVMSACGLTSTEEIIRENLRVYPNPAIDEVLLDSPYPIATIRIFDARGQLVLQSSNPANRLDVSAFANGVYLIRMEIEGKEYVQRLVIQ